MKEEKLIQWILDSIKDIADQDVRSTPEIDRFYEAAIAWLEERLSEVKKR